MSKSLQQATLPRRVGSAFIESPEQAGYEYAGLDRATGLYMFSIDGRKELFARGRTPTAGWQMQIGSQYYEFVRGMAVRS